jgi:putative ABC transport system permease protein
MHRLYRLLLKLYPARFREEFAAPLERQFADEYRDTATASERALLWLRTLADLAVTIPAELLREIGQDLRYAVRVYRRRALVTSLALTALALALGACTGVFSVVNALLIRSLPFRAPEHLVMAPVSPGGVAAAFDQWRHSAYLEDAALARPDEMTLLTGHGAARIHVAETSANFFDLLGAAPQLGRTFLSAEGRPGFDHVAVISHGLWQQFFGGDPRTLGATIRLQGVPLTVVGVVPPAFDYPGNTAVWIPTAFDWFLLPTPIKSQGKAVGRLRQGVAFSAANRIYRAELVASAPHWRVEVPSLIPLRDQLVGPVRQASLMLFQAVILVLLIACANVAQLLLSRTTDRRAAWTIRAALGASRARIVQQLVTESAGLTLVAACAGLAVARWTVLAASPALPAPLAAQAYTILDWRVLAFALTLTAFTGILFGIVPALLMRRWLADSSLGGKSATPRGLRTMRAIVVAVQAAVAVVLLAGSLTLGRSFLRLLGTDLGYRTDNVAALSVSLFGTRYQTEYGPAKNDHQPPEFREHAYYRQALDRLRSLPVVEAAGLVDYIPLTGEKLWSMDFTLDSGQEPLAMEVTASPGYFRSMGVPVVQGRDFADTDRQGSEPVAIVNEEFVRRTGLGSAILGHKVTPSSEKPLTIVGVVRTLLYDPLRRGNADAQVYMPLAQYPVGAATFAVRVRGDAARYLPQLRDSLAQVDASVPPYGVATLDARLRESLARPRFYTTAVLFFAGFAMLLAVVGVYGAASYSIAQRTQEIGVRIAVGASPLGLRATLLRRSMLPVAAGMAGGVAGAAAFGRYLQSLVATAAPAGFLPCLAAAALLVAATAVAVWTASSRIVRMDPAAALRSE